MSVVVDHVLGSSVSQEDGNNELLMLSYLSAGIRTLVNTVAGIEEPLQRQEAAEGRRLIFLGTPESFESIVPTANGAVLLCLFHWYGVSVCNYARLVGFLGGVGPVFARNATEDKRNHAKIKDHCDEYVGSISELAPILLWRNKVFAHFAITDPHRGDNAALLDLSTMPMIGYSDGHLRVGGVVVTTRGAESQLPPWSLTESFVKLAPRYWPNQQNERTQVRDQGMNG